MSRIAVYSGNLVYWKYKVTNELKPKRLSKSQQRRKNDILEASLKIFERDGFEAAKMIDIAEEAEVAKGTLYLYFDSKSALLEGVIQSAIIPTLKAADETSLMQETSETEVLKKQMQIMASRMASREMSILLRYMMSGKSEQHQKVIGYYFNNVIEPANTLLRQTLQRGAKTGEFRKSAAKIDPLVLLGAQIYTTVWKNLFEGLSPIEPNALAEDLMQVLLKGLHEN